MKVSSLEPSLEKEIQGVIEQFSGYVKTLPPELAGLTASSLLWKERGAGLSHYLPFWLNHEFAKGALLQQARQVALANRFGQIFCLLQDGVIDHHAGTKSEILILLNALFFQFLHRYQKLFPASHPFWTYFEEYWQEYLQALAWEKTRHHGRITPYTGEDFVWIARKFSPIKICCAGMALLAGREEEIPSLSRMIEHLQVGYQLLDDLKDWSEDIRNRDYTYPLTLVHLLSDRRAVDSPLPVDEIERLLWSQGLAREVLQSAIDYLSQSLHDISHLSLQGVKTRVHRLQEEARQQMEKIAKHLEKTEKPAELQIFSQNEHHIVLNVSTSTLYEIDQKAASILSRVIQDSWQANGSKDNEILKELQIAGVLSSLSPPKKEVDPPLTTLYLNVSSRCNLRCVYCFARGGEYGGETKLMSREVGERAVDLLLRESRAKSTAKIVFFGGEPLLNSELITHLIHYGKQKSAMKGKKMRFELVTNGTRLSSQMTDLFCREKVSIQISLDGPPLVQNRLRPTIRGEKTYERVLENIRKLQKRGVQRIGIRATISSLTPSPVEILEHLCSLGAGPIAMDYVSPTQDRRQVWTENDLSLRENIQEELAEYVFRNLRKGQLIPYANIMKPLIRLSRRDRFLYHCSAGITMGAVTTEGIVFPCFRFSEESSLAVGDVFTGLKREKLRPYIQSTVDQKKPCQTCWARYLCGGGCFYDNLLMNGDTPHPDRCECALIRHRFEVVVKLLARIKRELPQLVETIKKGEIPSFLREVEA